MKATREYLSAADKAKLIDHQIEILEAYKAGKKLQVRDKSIKNFDRRWTEFVRKDYGVFGEVHQFDFRNLEYKIKDERLAE